MLFAVLISVTISINGYQNVVENTEGIYLQSPHAEPTIIKTFVNPQKARCGETITIYALIHDATGIERVNATFFHEAGADTVEMNLLAGTERFGLWVGNWKVHDTLEKEYAVRVDALSLSGLSSFSEAIWKDPAPWWNIHWKYRRPITLDPATPVSDYQVKVVLTPDNFNYSKANPDGSDIRFCQADRTKLSYWIEEWNASGDSTIWVNVTQNGTDTIYMYYGNPSAKSESNGTSTFEFFDDFESPALDTAKWVVEEQEPTIQNSICRVVGGNSVEAIRTKKSFDPPFIVHFSMKPDSKSAGDWDSGIAIGQTTTDLLGFTDDAYGNYLAIMRLWWSRADYISVQRSDYSTFHEYQVIATSTGSTFKDLTDGRTNNDDYSRSYSGYLWLVNDNENGNNKGYYDRVFVRKYASSEPTATVGEEEVAMPTKPHLISPEENGSTNNATPTFKWQSAMYVDNYTLLVDNQSDFSSPKINVTLGPDATSYTVPTAKALSEGRWYWKVIASNMYGKNESDVRTFIYDRTPPAAPHLKSPEDNNVTDNKNVTFSWYPVSDDTSNSSDVSGIAYYQIQVSADRNFTNIVLDNTATGTSITREVEGRLYWRVRAWDKAGNAGDFSEIRNLTVFSFTLSASSTEAQIQRGSSISINISISVDFGEPEEISLSYSWIGAVTPSQVSISFNPQTINGSSNSSTLTITTESIASTGSFTCRVTATSDSGIKREIDIKITVYAMLFSLYYYPQEVTLMRSDSERITLSVEFDQGALDTVNLSGGWEGEVPEGVSVNILTSSGIPPYQTTVLVTTSDSAEKGTFVYRITGEGSGLERILNIYINVLTDLSLEVTTDKETYEKGDRIKIYGSVKDPFGDAVSEGSVKISIFDGKRKQEIFTSISDGTFSTGYYITFDKPEGEWHISVTAKDSNGDITSYPQNLTISVKSPETCKFLLISVVNPSYGQIFRRGETVTFTAIVTDDGRKVSGAAVRGYLPDGDIIVFSEGEPGFYTSSYKLRYDCKFENWTVYIEGIKDTDGVLKSGFAWVTFRVLPAKPIYQIINQLPRKVEAGEEVEIEIKALYPDGTPIEDGVIKATAQDGEEIVFNPIGSGIYVASFTPEEGGTDWLINVTISDSYGNVASLSLGKINVTTPSVSTYAVRYWWATLALSSLTAIAVGAFTHRRLLFIRLKKYRKDIQNLERQKRMAAERYFLKGEITREAYDKIIQECESRIAELSKKCGILEKEIRKLRRVKS